MADLRNTLAANPEPEDDDLPVEQDTPEWDGTDESVGEGEEPEQDEPAPDQPDVPDEGQDLADEEGDSE